MWWWGIPVLINFKICDNSVDCSGISSCPLGVFSWDQKKKTIVIDNSKCSSCGICEPTCPVGAIRVARNDKEFEMIKKELARDKRQVSDLFVDRYGAQPMHKAFLASQEKFDEQILTSSKLVVAEFFNRASINCLYCSIPIKTLFEGKDIKYRKVELVDDFLQKKYSVSNLPALLFFKNGSLIGKIEGHYEPGKEKELFKQIQKIVKK